MVAGADAQTQEPQTGRGVEMAGKVSARVAGAAGDPAPWASTSASSVGILMTSAAQTAREAPMRQA